MKSIIITLFCIVIALTSNAQGKGPAKQGVNLQGLKIAYITRELNLTTDEAQKFWPVYFGYFDELKNARNENKDDVIAFDEKALAIKKRYFSDFKKVLGTDERANKVFLVDRDFGAIIKKEIQNRQKMRNNNPR
jgi:hypothetical protein